MITFIIWDGMRRGCKGLLWTGAGGWARESYTVSRSVVLQSSSLTYPFQFFEGISLTSPTSPGVEKRVKRWGKEEGEPILYPYQKLESTVEY